MSLYLQDNNTKSLAELLHYDNDTIEHLRAEITDLKSIGESVEEERELRRAQINYLLKALSSEQERGKELQANADKYEKFQEVWTHEKEQLHQELTEKQNLFIEKQNLWANEKDKLLKEIALVRGDPDIEE